VKHGLFESVVKRTIVEMNQAEASIEGVHIRRALAGGEDEVHGAGTFVKPAGSFLPGSEAHKR